MFYAGFTFREISSARASTNKVVCCHFSSDGNLLATGGHDKKVNMHVHTNQAAQSKGYCLSSGDLHPKLVLKLKCTTVMFQCRWYCGMLKL